jgi:putative acetyltransferase
MTEILIRQETSNDYEGISMVNDLSFGGKEERELIINLRKRPEFIEDLSLVAVADNLIIGHILFFPIFIVTEDKKYQTLSLAPMSVMPGFQKKGTGGDLIRAGLNKANKMGFDSVVVLGHPEYYPRFGFLKASKWSIRASFDVPDEAMMAMELKPGSLNLGGGIIDYPEEYYAAL